MKKHFIELAMAVLMLVCFYILSWEAAETAGRFIDVSGNIKADQVILVDAGHGGVEKPTFYDIDHTRASLQKIISPVSFCHPRP